MKQGLYEIISNEPLTKDVYKMILAGDTTSLTNPGQFINIKVDGFFLRRPISVCDYSVDTITIIYRVVGGGTEALSNMKNGESLDILCGLGNGYNTDNCGEHPLLIGGGVGVPPLYGLCRKLIDEGKRPIAILGFKTSDEVFYEEEFKKLGAQTFVTTEDGTFGEKGFVTDVMKNLSYTYFYTCGPLPMFKAIESIAKTSGQFSFEERMGCGFGACMGCTCKTKYGNKRICKDGPVLQREEIVW